MQRFHSSHSCNFLVGKSSTEVSLRHFFAGGCAWLQHRALRLQLPRVGWSRVFWHALLAGEQAQEPVGFATNKEDHLSTGNHRNYQKLANVSPPTVCWHNVHSNTQTSKVREWRWPLWWQLEWYSHLFTNYPNCFWTHMQSGKPRPSVTQFNSSWLDKKEADTCWVSEYVFWP